MVNNSTNYLFLFLGKRTGFIWIHRTSWPGLSISSKRQKSISSLTYTHTPSWADSFLSFLTKARPWRFTIFSDRRSLSHVSVMQIISIWCCFCCWKTCYKYSFIQGTCYMTFDKIKPLLRALLSWFRLGFWLRWLAWSWLEYNNYGLNFHKFGCWLLPIFVIMFSSQVFLLSLVPRVLIYFGIDRDYFQQVRRRLHAYLKSWNCGLI